MEISTPTFYSLPLPQKRALILRDQLRYLESSHLDTFIHGISNPEPPVYHLRGTTIDPPLTFVSLEYSATRFDLGNVVFHEEGNEIKHAWLNLGDEGEVEMRVQEALNGRTQELENIPIHSSIAKTMVPMFQRKLSQIYERVRIINRERKRMYEMAEEKLEGLEERERQSRVYSSKADQLRSTTNDLTKPRLNSPNQPTPPCATAFALPRHPANSLDEKHTIISFIPTAQKISAIDTLPSNIKLSLFDHVLETAVPHFNDLIIAARNVVSMYEAAGTMFADAPMAVSELGRALGEFDGCTEGRRDHDGRVDNALGGAMEKRRDNAREWALDPRNPRSTSRFDSVREEDDETRHDDEREHLLYLYQQPRDDNQRQITLWRAQQLNSGDQQHDILSSVSPKRKLTHQSSHRATKRPRHDTRDNSRAQNRGHSLDKHGREQSSRPASSRYIQRPTSRNVHRNTPTKRPSSLAQTVKFASNEHRTKIIPCFRNLSSSPEESTNESPASQDIDIEEVETGMRNLGPGFVANPHVRRDMRQVERRVRSSGNNSFGNLSRRANPQPTQQQHYFNPISSLEVKPNADKSQSATVEVKRVPNRTIRTGPAPWSRQFSAQLSPTQLSPTQARQGADTPVQSIETLGRQESSNTSQEAPQNSNDIYQHPREQEGRRQTQVHPGIDLGTSLLGKRKKSSGEEAWGARAATGMEMGVARGGAWAKGNAMGNAPIAPMVHVKRRQEGEHFPEEHGACVNGES